MRKTGKLFPKKCRFFAMQTTLPVNRLRTTKLNYRDGGNEYACRI
jgi:hypothetical protein